MTDTFQAATGQNPGIDAEHLIQTGLVEALCSAVESGQPAEQIAAILHQLAVYSEAHFMSEEMLMRLASYDGYDEHIADHDRMLDALEDIEEHQQSGDSTLVAGQARAMLDFLLQHIHTRDQQFQVWKRS
jgi:hemerythrin-like metal-binding protein